jgi:hypothetical protein
MNVTHQTRTGICAAVARWFEFVQVSWTLHWAEQDRNFLELQVRYLPAQLVAKDRDIEHLRVRQALLRRR